MARRNFAGGKLVKDAERLRALDVASPPEAKPCLMEVVRTLSDYIDTRARLGWTDPMIAELLTEAGYPISAGTLRSYRKRLRDEAGGPATSKETRPPTTVETCNPVLTAPPPVAASPIKTEPLRMKAEQSAPQSGTFAVNRKNLPNERA